MWSGSLPDFQGNESSSISRVGGRGYQVTKPMAGRIKVALDFTEGRKFLTGETVSGSCRIAGTIETY